MAVLLIGGAEHLAVAQIEPVGDVLAHLGLGLEVHLVFAALLALVLLLLQAHLGHVQAHGICHLAGEGTEHGGEHGRGHRAGGVGLLIVLLHHMGLAREDHAQDLGLGVHRRVAAHLQLRLAGRAPHRQIHGDVGEVPLQQHIQGGIRLGFSPKLHDGPLHLEFVIQHLEPTPTQAGLAQQADLPLVVGLGLHVGQGLHVQVLPSHEQRVYQGGDLHGHGRLRLAGFLLFVLAAGTSRHVHEHHLGQVAGPVQVLATADLAQPQLALVQLHCGGELVVGQAAPDVYVRGQLAPLDRVHPEVVVAHHQVELEVPRDQAGNGDLPLALDVTPAAAPAQLFQAQLLLVQLHGQLDVPQGAHAREQHVALAQVQLAQHRGGTVQGAVHGEVEVHLAAAGANL